MCKDNLQSEEHLKKCKNWICQISPEDKKKTGPFQATDKKWGITENAKDSQSRLSSQSWQKALQNWEMMLNLARKIVWLLALVSTNHIAQILQP